MSHPELGNRASTAQDEAFEEVECMLLASEPRAPKPGVTKDRSPRGKSDPRAPVEDTVVVWLDD